MIANLEQTTKHAEFIWILCENLYSSFPYHFLIFLKPGWIKHVELVWMGHEFFHRNEHEKGLEGYFESQHLGLRKIC